MEEEEEEERKKGKELTKFIIYFIYHCVYKIHLSFLFKKLLYIRI